MTALLALASSLLWGTGDFLGGRASRTWHVFTVLFWSQLAALVLMWLAVGIGVSTGWLEFSWHAVGYGMLGGFAGVIALAAFYRALATGPMAVVPPIAASGVVLPVLVGLATGAAPSVWALVGLGLAIVGVILAAAGTGDPATSTGATRISPTTLMLSLVAAVGFALIFVALDVAAGDSARTAVLATAGVRLGSFSTLLVAIALVRIDPTRGVSVPDAARFAFIGILDTGANLLFAVAAAVGALEVAAVLGSLYPAVTSGLAHVVLGERLGRIQLVGVACALVGIVVLAAT
ncbi:MAG: protein of unknown function transrane [Thermoleophilia bacterium]|nr:protein of unknown function transrane [Thermoleophilia bacterium]MCZ4496268.1 protein of unknown function transrane [Thermoleophilia bacterium]